MSDGVQKIILFFQGKKTLVNVLDDKLSTWRGIGTEVGLPHFLAFWRVHLFTVQQQCSTHGPDLKFFCKFYSTSFLLSILY